MAVGEFNAQFLGEKLRHLGGPVIGVGQIAVGVQFQISQCGHGCFVSLEIVL